MQTNKNNMRLAIFSSPAGMLLTELSLAGNNFIIPVNLFFTVYCNIITVHTFAGPDTHDRGLLCHFSYRHCRQVLMYIHIDKLINNYIYHKFYDDAGNLCVCMVIVKDKSLHTATNYYLFSLAMADLVILVLGTLKGQYCEIFHNFYFGPKLSAIGEDIQKAYSEIIGKCM
jgi:hypothetical protein